MIVLEISEANLLNNKGDGVIKNTHCLRINAWAAARRDLRRRMTAPADCCLVFCRAATIFEMQLLSVQDLSQLLGRNCLVKVICHPRWQFTRFMQIDLCSFNALDPSLTRRIWDKRQQPVI
ncbi:hypothetical protein VTP01DRAFT_1682 [Rhizomucor pusillus]|uniref:uncharacterized protein n=1 Tax=Rhizomucor pusillus TaxID=4840 RepID=UPI0037435FAC